MTPTKHLVNGMRHAGGRWWVCATCGTYRTADCYCCEPARCPCQSTQRRERYLRETAAAVRKGMVRP